MGVPRTRLRRCARVDRGQVLERDQWTGSRRRGYGDEDALLRGAKAPHARFAHIAHRPSVKDALDTKVALPTSPRVLTAAAC